MEDIKISLCIPTKNRFDNFLSRYLDDYLDYLKRGVIDEIVIADETGYDYDKINEKYGEYIGNNTNFRVFKNDEILGVFKNKIHVSCLAVNNLVALIDSDNFADDNYFLRIKKFLSENNLSEHFIISPDFAAPNFNFSAFDGLKIVRNLIKDYFNKDGFKTLLNLGNYVFTKNIMENLQYDNSPETLFKITACDVLYFNLLFFQQYDDLIFYCLKDLSYTHVCHSDSEYLKTQHNCNYFRDTFVYSSYENL